MSCIDIPALHGLGDFSAIRTWVDRVHAQAAANGHDPHKVIATTLHVSPPTAKDVHRLISLPIVPTTHDVSSAAGASKAQAAAVVTSAAAALHTAHAVSLEAQMRTLLDQEEAASGDQRVALQIRIAELARELAGARVQAVRAATTSGALRAAAKFSAQAQKARTSEDCSQHMRKAATALQTADMIARTNIKVFVPDFTSVHATRPPYAGVVPPGRTPQAVPVRGGGIPSYIATAMLMDNTPDPLPALSGLAGAADFNTQARDFLTKSRNPLSSQALTEAALATLTSAGAPVGVNYLAGLDDAPDVVNAVADQVPAATPAAMPAPKKTSWAYWVVPSLAVGAGLALHIFA